MVGEITYQFSLFRWGYPTPDMIIWSEVNGDALSVVIQVF